MWNGGFSWTQSLCLLSSRAKVLSRELLCCCCCCYPRFRDGYVSSWSFILQEELLRISELIPSGVVVIRSWEQGTYSSGWKVPCKPLLAGLCAMAGGQGCALSMGTPLSCVTFEHNTQTALAGINCPQRAAVCVQCVRLRGCLAHMKLIRAVEWYRTRASFSLVNNLCPAFTASFSQAEVEAKRAEQWDIETNCAEEVLLEVQQKQVCLLGILRKSSFILVAVAKHALLTGLSGLSVTCETPAPAWAVTAPSPGAFASVPAPVLGQAGAGSLLLPENVNMFCTVSSPLSQPSPWGLSVPRQDTSNFLHFGLCCLDVLIPNLFVSSQSHSEFPFLAADAISNPLWGGGFSSVELRVTVGVVHCGDSAGSL
ncbi:hypothetical protein EK904_003953, partial [Melospiza melodia maxima]